MKYCPKCGYQLPDDARFCIKCGSSVPVIAVAAPTPAPAQSAAPASAQDRPSTSSAKPSDLKVITKVFLILGCVLNGFYLLSLCWTIPMTVHYFKRVKENKPVGTGFKVCCVLFVSFVAGVIMLCDNELS